MDDPLFVRGFECFRDLRRDGQRFIDRNPFLRDSIGECRPLDQFQHQRVRAAAILKAVDGRDVRMIE